jgi:hypothetical protein
MSPGRPSFEPNHLTTADLDRLRQHYKDLQILEIITSVAGFNAMNRWTGSVGLDDADVFVDGAAAGADFDGSRVHENPYHDALRLFQGYLLGDSR